QLDITLQMEGDIIRDIRHEGKGCAISTASASLMSEAVKGKSRQEVETLFEQVHAMLTQANGPMPTGLGKLAALAGVREFPARVKCASLCWHTLNAALAGRGRTISTE
ncbi:MAG: Fe-S cluster assembly sulfur transfer protein SufU, partial [Steroidobacteraceae bacterium]